MAGEFCNKIGPEGESCVLPSEHSSHPHDFRPRPVICGVRDALRGVCRLGPGHTGSPTTGHFFVREVGSPASMPPAEAVAAPDSTSVQEGEDLLEFTLSDIIASGAHRKDDPHSIARAVIAELRSTERLAPNAPVEAPISRDAIKAALQSLVQTADELEAQVRLPAHAAHRVNLQQSAARQLLEAVHGVEDGRVDALSRQEPELPALAEFLPHHALAAIYKASAEALPQAMAAARSVTDELSAVRRAAANLVELYFGLFGEDVRPCVSGVENLVPDGDKQ